MELRRRIAGGAEVKVLGSQVESAAVKEQMDREYLAGWFEGSEGGGIGQGSKVFEEGKKDGERYRFRRANGLEKYAGPRWEARLVRIKERRLRSLETSPAR